MERSHTPGPWTACPPNYGAEPDERPQHYWAIRCPGQGPVISYELARISGHSDADEANARLIAAAPDLLAACEAVFNAVDMTQADQFAAIKMVVDAIAKATGSQS